MITHGASVLPCDAGSCRNYLDAIDACYEQYTKTRTIGQNTSTPEQDGHPSSPAKYVTGRDRIGISHHSQQGLARLPKWRGETMKRLTSEVLYHPFVAQSTFYLTDLLSRADLGLSGALFVLAVRSVARFLRARRNDAA